MPRFSRRNCDAYHTCYNLAGLSAAQNYSQYQPSTPGEAYPALTAGFHWKTSKTPFTGRNSGGRIFYESDRVGFINPVYVIPAGAAEAARGYFEDKPLS